MENINTKILDCKNLRISFKTINGTVKAVRGIDFSLYRGKTLAIVGESGSGKSVTSRAVMGILAGNKIVEEGEILYGDRDLLQTSEEDYCKIRGSKISMIFQDPLSSLNPIMKVGKQVTESMKLKRKAEKHDSKVREKLLLKQINAFIETLPEGEEKSSVLSSLENLLKVFKIDDGKKLLFDLNKYNRITNDKVVAFEKAIVNTVNENQKAKLQKQLDSYKAKRLVKHDEIKKEYDARVALVKKEGIDYKDFDFSILDALCAKMHMKNYEGLINKYVENGEKFSALYDTFSSLDGLDFINALKKNLKELNSFVQNCQDQFALEKDEMIFTFFVGTKHVINEYFAAVKREKKALALEQKNEKLVKKGVSTDPTVKQRAWGSEIDTSSQSKITKLKENLSNMIKAFKVDYIASSKELMEDENLKFNAHRYIKALSHDVKLIATHTNNEEFVEKAINLLGEVGIPEPEKRIKQYPFEFSGGMRQRIVIAIALSSNPEILICDEPTTALDVTIQAQILELINKLKVKRNLSIIFITHNLGVVANMADSIAVMYAGKIVEYGTVDEIFYNPKHPYTWALLASMPDLETKTKLDPIPGTPPNMIIPPKGDAFAARNKYAMKIDYEKEPPRFYVSDTHWAATWLLADGAPKVEPPLIVTERINRMMKLNKISENDIGKKE